MSTKSKSKDDVPVAGMTRGRRLSTGLASTPESKPKSTHDQKSTSGQSQTPVKVPHYLQASTGSCHDFCKYGGRRDLEEEEEKNGSRLSRKKNGLIKGPRWKDIISYDAMPKAAKRQVVPLVSKKMAVPTKPELERLSGSVRPNLHRRTSLEASCSGTKPVVLTPVKISSAPAKTKVTRPGTMRKESDIISNGPKTRKRNEQKVNRGSTDIVKNCAEVDMRPTGTIDENGGGGDVERTLYVVEPVLEFKLVPADSDFCKKEPIEDLKPDFKETNEIDFGTEGGNAVENNEVTKCEGTGTGKAPPSPDKEIVAVESESELSQKNKNSEPENGAILKSGFISSESGGKLEPELPPSPEKEIVVVESESELREKSKNSEPEDVVILKSGSISSVSGGKLEPELPRSPDKGTVVVESESELSEKSNASEPENEAILKPASISSESCEKLEPESESEFELSDEVEESMEFESEPESESESGIRCVSSGSVESAPKIEKLEVECSNRRRNGSGQLEEMKPHKLKFKLARVIELKPDSDSAPRRLKFRKPRLVGENPKSSSDGRKVSYKKRSGSDPTGSNSVDPETAGPVLRHQDGNERKEEQSLFNNVIEETASKLVKSRKSKVKALVGAFETVISLQDSKPTSSA